MDQPVLLSIQVALPRDIGSEAATDPMDQRWHSAFFKLPVDGPVHVGRLTVSGDGQADLRVHGGPDRPVLAYCAEHYDRWKKELHISETPFGGFGENFTIHGMDERTVCLGDQYALGPVRLEVSQPRQPCWKLARRWRNKELPAMVIRHSRGGWYFRVLAEGNVDRGMPFELLERPHPKWTISRAMDVMYHGKDDQSAMSQLAAIPALSEQWREHFKNRLGD